MTGISNVTAARAFQPHDESCEYCGGKGQVGVCGLRRRPRDGVFVADPLGEPMLCPSLGGLAHLVDLLPAPVSPPTTGGGAA